MYHLTTLVVKMISMRFNKASLLILGGFFLSFSACQEGSSDSDKVEEVKFQVRGEAQGTTYNVIYYAEEESTKKEELDSLLKKFDNSLSNWVPTSIVSQINGSQDPNLTIRDTFGLFAEMFEQSKYFYKLSMGAFDPSVMPLVNAWGFGLSNRSEMDSTIVDSLLTFVGFRDNQMSIDRTGENLALSRKPGAQLDFNAIAQGYSVDLLTDFLRSKQISSFMVELGGEMRVGDPKPNGEAWKVGIDKPMDPEKGREIQKIIELQNKAVATSGSYRKFYEKDGMRYSHTIDPSTGFPVNHNLLSATIVSESAAKSDALATICMVLGLKPSIAFLEKMKDDLKVYLIYQDKKDKSLKVYEN